MAVLSDKTIKERIAKNELIPGGDPNSATHCSYEFTAALMLRGGSHQEERIESGVVIEPAQLVWIRAREEISLPANMVGLWIQTQTLAREGLLLLNISLIEPGYRGPLSAVLVNFGKKPVPISPRTKIAKVIFLPLDGAATKLVEGYDSEQYNDDLKRMAVTAPNTFLQLQSFEQKAKDILDLMKKEMEQSVNSMADTAKDKIIDDLQSDLKGTLLKWGGLTLAGLLFGCALVWLMITSYLPRLSEYSKFDEMARRAAMTQQSETIAGLTTRLDSQATEIESLKKQLSSVKVRDSKPQGQTNSSDTTRLTSPDNTVPKQ